MINFDMFHQRWGFFFEGGLWYNGDMSETEWKDRLIYTEEQSVIDLLPLFHPDNPKIHPQGQTDALKGAIGTIGWMARPKLNVRSSDEWGELANIPIVIDGHDRIKAASEENQESLNCDFYDLTPNEEGLFLLTYDPIGMMAVHDRTAVESLLQQVNTDNEQLQEMLAEFAEQNDILIDGLLPPPEDAEPQINRADELQEIWQVKTGQMWRLPSRTEGQEHRIICGDCTDREVVERVMGGEVIRFEFSDPPYDFDTSGGGILSESRHMNEIERAQISTFDPMSIEIISPTSLFCCNKPLVPIYIKLAQGNKVSWDLAFYKKHNTPPNYGGHMMTDVEYLIVIGKQSPYPGMEKDTYSKGYIGGLDEGHVVAWQKPIGLVEKFVKLFTKPSEVVIDRFLCTGTTLIAAENLSRQCRAIEISPPYVAVALQRYADAFGIKPELVTHKQVTDVN